jgi:hypothetical protein
MFPVLLFQKKKTKVRKKIHVQVKNYKNQKEKNLKRKENNEFEVLMIYTK